MDVDSIDFVWIHDTSKVFHDDA
ncbi:hypothetical protein EMIT0194MI4_20404 [Pseudomonas sp. IT-194MI4]